MIANLGIPELLQPFLDYAFGFRRGTSAGQPADNAGPRAEVPFPGQRDSQTRRTVGPMIGRTRLARATAIVLAGLISAATGLSRA